MPLRHPEPHPFRVAFPFFFALILIGLWNVIGTELTSAAIPQPYIVDVAGQFSDDRLTSSDVGIATSLLTEDTIVHTPNGTFAGPESVTTYIASLEQGYPDAQFAVTDGQSAGGITVVNWQGTIDGQVVVPGRTVIIFEDGAIAEVSILNLNDVSPSQSPPVVVEQPDVVFAVRTASIEAQAWPDFDPSSLADQVERVGASEIEAQRWPDFDPSSLTP